MFPDKNMPRPQVQAQHRLTRLKAIEQRIMREISQGLSADLPLVIYWIQMQYGSHSKTAREYLVTLEGSGKFEIDWDHNLILPPEQQEEE